MEKTTEQAAKEQLEKVFESGKWMAVAITVAEDGSMTLHRTTNEFPVAAYPAAMRLLWDNLAESVAGPRPAPLPVADLRIEQGHVQEAVGLEEAIDRR